MELGADRIDDSGPNKGYYELAGLAELQTYFQRAMYDHLLPTGRVTYLPLTDYLGNRKLRGILSGRESTVRYRKLVDSTFYDTSVPATHTPQFSIAEGVRMTIPGRLPDLWMQREAMPGHFTVLGGGKTAMDTVVWLLEAGVDPGAIAWVRPRESWLINRARTQPGVQFLTGAAGFQRSLFEIGGNAQDADALFLGMEERGHMLRIDPDILPTKFFFATVSSGEVERLRSVQNIIAIGRISRIDKGLLRGSKGTAETPAGTLHIDCTASAVRARPVGPQFDGDTITLQPIQAPLVTLSASVTAWLEVHCETDHEKNALGTPVPLRGDTDHYPVMVLGNAMNRAAWGQHAPLAKWLGKSRLDPLARTIAMARKEQPDILKPFADIGKLGMAAIPNLARLAQAAREKSE